MNLEKFVIKLAELRNERINFSNRTYKIEKSYYHCIARKKSYLVIFDTNYDLINIDKINIISDNDASIKFKDNINEYSYNYAKSTLFKKFIIPQNHKTIDIQIIDNPLDLILKIFNEYNNFEITEPKDFVILPLYSCIKSKIKNENKKYVPERDKIFKNKLNLNDIEWKEFKIMEVFEVSGTITTHPSQLKPNGKTPRITCASTNNALDDTYANSPTEKGKVLTIDSATVDYVSYQENDFIATDHVEKIWIKNNKAMNRYIGLFLKQCIDNAVLLKYGYGYKFSQTRIKKQIVNLPIDSKGEPHWEFMENFMREVEYKKLNLYLDYIKKSKPNL